MRVLLGSQALCLSIVAVACDFYNPRYDNFDIQPLLDNDRILTSYMKCFLDQGPCTPEAKDFKKVLPEALATACARCSRQQRALIQAVLRSLLRRMPDRWQQLLAKYDPGGAGALGFDVDSFLNGE